jgi:hypothetical protein
VFSTIFQREYFRGGFYRAWSDYIFGFNLDRWGRR